jgi:hypothetical protein
MEGEAPVNNYRELRDKTAKALAVHEARMAAHYDRLLNDRPAMTEARQIQCDLKNLVEELDRDIRKRHRAMTREEAFEALTTELGMTGKMAGFLLSEAKKYGSGAHLKCDVVYSDDLGYVIVDCPRNDGEGRWVVPGTADD